MRSRRSLLLGSAALAVILVAGFAAFLVTRSPKVIMGGPLGPPTNASGECITGSPGSAQTDGFDEVINQGSQVVVIERLALRSPHDLKLAGSYVVPVVPVPARTDSFVVGVWATFPPPARQVDHLAGLQWAKREAPRDARLLPGHKLNLVVGVRVTSGLTGSEQGLAVYYRVGSQQYLFMTQSHLEVKVKPMSCV